MFTTLTDSLSQPQPFLPQPRFQSSQLSEGSGCDQLQKVPSSQGTRRCIELDADAKKPGCTSSDARKGRAILDAKGDSAESYVAKVASRVVNGSQPRTAPMPKNAIHLAVGKASSYALLLSVLAK